MKYKYINFFVAFCLVKCVSPKTFTIVLDTTVSMQEEIDVLKRNLPNVVNILKNSSDFEEFTVVPFNDPDVGTPIILTNPDQLVESLSVLSISGGRDCPEDSLSGIQKALEISKPESLVYVFTDAFSKDDSKLRNIEALCKSTRSQVVIFLSGSCYGSGSRQQGNVDVYYEIARACSGMVFRFDVISLRKAFKYIEEMVAADWNDVTSHERFTGHNQLTFSVDTFTKDVLVAVSGDYPFLQITDSQGQSPEVQKIMDSRRALVVRVSSLTSGTYQVIVRCQSETSLTIYKRDQIPFEYGFSTRLPRSLKETSLRPIPGWLNYILIVIPPTYNIQITSLELQMLDGDDKHTLAVNESETKQGFYVTSVFMEPDRSFKCVLHGRDSTTYEEITGSTKVVNVQKLVQVTSWTKPELEIIQPEDELVDFGTNLTVACKVKGYPKPNIQWNEQDSTAELMISTEEILLEMPSTYINYATMNATSNMTLCCSAVNARGEDVKCVDVYVNRTFTFDVVESPRAETFEYGTEGKLKCIIDAYPEPEIKWYHNGTLIGGSDNLEIEDGSVLIIKNMTVDDIGEYKCEATNALKTEIFLAEVTISGLDAPELEIDNAEVILSPGDYKNIECRVVKGNPKPEITWKYQVSYESDFEISMPDEVYVEEGQLKIPSVKTEHKGIYRCTASNTMGEDYKDITVKIQYAPKITSADDSTLVVMEGDMVELPCDVDATPEATVRWEVTQDDVIVALDDRHTTDERNTHRFVALWKDSGNYHCIAVNDIGRTEKTVTVNVQVAPFIEPPEARVVEASAGTNVVLTCNVLYGNPVPTNKWEFVGYNANPTVLSRGNSTSSLLRLNNVSRANEGMYLCIADNSVGNDRIRIHLRVK